MTSENTTIQLAPCPFCKSSFPDLSFEDPVSVIKCSCGASFSAMSTLDAVYGWNKRSLLSAYEEAFEEAKKMIHFAADVMKNSECPNPDGWDSSMKNFILQMSKLNREKLSS